MNKLKTLFLLALLIVSAGIFTANANYPFTRINGFEGANSYLEIGYIGIGSKNEVLTFAEFNHAAAGPITVNYKLTDNKSGANITKYIDCICFFARKYVDDWNTCTNLDQYGTNPLNKNYRIPLTYLHNFNPADPLGKTDKTGVEGLFLGEIKNLGNTAEQEFVSKVNLPAGNWVIYMTVDMKAFDVVDANVLPYLHIKKTEGGKEIIEKNFTRIGGQITKIGNKTFSVVTPNDINLDSNILSDLKTNGSRVIVPRRSIIYQPGDYYSKFYRIPAITTTGDGTLMAVSDARKYHVHDISNDIDQVARFSHDLGKTWTNPINIYKGESTGPNECSTAMGFGDAAVAKLPNGALLMATTSGGPLSKKATPCYYKLSYDNGKSWTTRKPLKPKNLEGTETYDFSQYQGCIAPGNMCVVKEGYYAGKILACYREFDSGNYILCYDPELDSWTVLKSWRPHYALLERNASIEYFELLQPGDNKIDEAHLIEISKDKFLLTSRNNGGNKRLFSWIDIVSKPFETDVEYGPWPNYKKTKRTVDKIGSFGMFTRSYKIEDVVDKDLYMPCNADALAVMTSSQTEKVQEQPYIIQPLVSKKITTESQKGISYKTYDTRSGLTLYYSNDYDNKDLINNDKATIGFTTSLELGDPFGNALNENTQYCSLTEQADGTIGFLFEEYPFGVYRRENNCPFEGDFVMHIAYMNLRIGDIIGGAEPSRKIRLEAPNVDPNSCIYDINTPGKWGTLNISHNNAPEVFTYYKIEYKAPDTEIFKQIDLNNDNVADYFQNEQSHTIQWSEIQKYVPAEMQKKGLTIRVSAWCVPAAGTEGEYTQSYVDSELYTFDYPIYKIALKSYPTGVGNVLMSIQNVDEYEDGQIGQVANKMKIRLTSSSDPGFSFDTYKIAINSSLEANLSNVGNISYRKITNDSTIVEFTFRAEEIATAAAGDSISFEHAKVDGVYTIYAAFKSNGTTGLNTKVSVLHNGKIDKGSNIIYDPNTGMIADPVTEYGHNYWSTAGESVKKDIDFYDNKNPNASLDLGNPSQKDNDATLNELQVKFKNYEAPYLGIHANVEVLPDAFTAQYYGAVIALRQGEGKNARYLKWQPYIYDKPSNTVTFYEEERYVYTVLNSALRNFTPAVCAKAYSVEDWSVLNPDGLTASPVIANYTPAHNQYPCAWDWGDSYFAIERMNGIKFPRIDKYTGFDNELFKTGHKLFIDIFVASPKIGSVNEVIEGGKYLFKVSHPITYDGSVQTGVEDITAAQKLSVRSAKGGVLLNTAEPVNVRIANTMGMIVKDFELTESEFVELPQGIYIANGIKFAVY